MAATLYDSPYYRDRFSTAAMRAAFSDEARFASWLAFEAALARAQAACGLVPPEAAEAITRAARADRLDAEEMRAEFEEVGFAILPLVRQLTAACPPERGSLGCIGARRRRTCSIRASSSRSGRASDWSRSSSTP